ncbi:MAG: caspase family protein, partial [Chitinophagaceae bacterium]|nr:caspase family protein [Chitinophagaceae bacterium]
MAVFALLVGINEYHPDSKVSGLHGCTNDVDIMREYIRENFPSDPETNIIALKNETATRTKVVETFKQHLCNNSAIKNGDSVLFYYSGHGSYAPSAKEFIALNEDSKAQDETLVLYDSRVDGNFDLADKELALLLSVIPKHANIVVVLDSCHSGSATRNVNRADEIKLGLPRFTSKSNQPRELVNYIDVNGLSYKKMNEQGKLEIPKSKHILLAACGRDELAYESSSARGLFSNWLTDLLEDTATNATYAQLQENLYTVIKRRANKQTPQLKAYEAFNPNLLFLKNEASAGKAVYKVVFKSPDWVINYGALNGLPPDKDVVNNCQVQLYETGNPKPVHTVSIKKVGLNESVLNMPGDVNSTTQFSAEVINMPPTLFIYVDGETTQKDGFFSLLEEEKQVRPFLLFHQDASAFYNLVVDLNDNQVVIRDPETKQLVHGIITLNKDTVHYIVDALLQIAKWKNLERLEHPQSTIPENDIEFALQLKDENGSWTDCDGSSITLDITKEKPEIPFRIMLKNVSDTPYYIALYRLASTFAIEKHSKDVDASLLKKDAVPSLECYTQDDEEPCSFV